MVGGCGGYVVGGWGGYVVGGWGGYVVGEIKNTAKLSPAGAGTWAELGNNIIYDNIIGEAGQFSIWSTKRFQLLLVELILGCISRFIS